MKINLLLTDKCFLIVLLLSMVLLLRGLRKEHIRRALQAIFKKPVPLCSAIILLFFLIVGVIDSIHVRTEAKSLSILDQI